MGECLQAVSLESERVESVDKAYAGPSHAHVTQHPLELTDKRSAIPTPRTAIQQRAKARILVQGLRAPL